MVEVHYFSLDVDAARLSELNGLLSWEERERAARFRFNRDRNRFTACRGTLRELLGASAAVRFVYGAFGKPRLEDSEIRFNVSHSRGMAMIAIARGREVGCDIEWIDSSFADETIPEHFFSPYEVAALRALPAEEQCDAFFRCWTRKEAFIKACGMGMSMALDSFDVSLEHPVLMRGGKGWVLRDVEAPAGYVAALVLSESQAEPPAPHCQSQQVASVGQAVSPANFDQPEITMPTSSLISSMTKSGGAAANVSG